ncbi:MAG: RNA polymerase-binding protein DksA [Burkholderiaceae bacterium]
MASVKAAVPAKALSQASAAAAPKVAKKPAPASATRSAAPLAAAAVQPPSNLPPKLKTGTPLVNASSSAATVKPAAPQAAAPTKARSARAASITVPSMAQTVASTAAKSSYTQLPAPMVLVPILQASPVKDPKLVNNWKTKTADQLSDEEVLAMPDAQYMSDLQMAFFRLKLQQLKQEILNSAGETTEHLREETVIVPDPADRATIEEEHALELRTRDRERKLLKKIEQSITRIDAGDYGYCDETGEAIGVGRLMARPTATLSLEAQQRRELRQKMFGD